MADTVSRWHRERHRVMSPGSPPDLSRDFSRSAASQQAMWELYDLLSYPVRLRCGAVADDAVSVEGSVAERDRDRGATYGPALAIAVVPVGVIVTQLWGSRRSWV